LRHAVLPRKAMKLPSGRELVLLAGAALLLVAYVQHSRADDADTAALEAVLASREKDLKGAQIAIAAKTEENNKLKRLNETAKLVGGRSATVVAGFAIAVPKRDTVVVHDTVTTQLLADSTRLATFRDSTFAGIFTVHITAPPFPANLSVVDSVSRPAFRPEVGFFKIGSKYVASVAWQGEKFDIDAPFFNTDQVKPTKHFVPWAEGTYAVGGGANEIRAGAAIKAFGLEIGPSISQRLTLADLLKIGGQPPSIGLTLRKEW
jgi:hypothetical protein